jgi:hypothetical protein
MTCKHVEQKIVCCPSPGRLCNYSSCFDDLIAQRDNKIHSYNILDHNNESKCSIPDVIV